MGRRVMDGGVELARQVRRLTVAGGLLVAIDDAQWLDEQSVELLGISPHARPPATETDHERFSSLSAVAPASCGPHHVRPRCSGDDPRPALSCGRVHTGRAMSGTRLPRVLPPAPATRPPRESRSRARPRSELSTRRLSPSAETVQWVQKVTSRTVARSVLERLSRLPDDATLVLEAVAVAGDPAAASDCRGSETELGPSSGRRPALGGAEAGDAGFRTLADDPDLETKPSTRRSTSSSGPITSRLLPT